MPVANHQQAKSWAFELRIASQHHNAAAAVEKVQCKLSKNLSHASDSATEIPNIPTIMPSTPVHKTNRIFLLLLPIQSLTFYPKQSFFSKRIRSLLSGFGFSRGFDAAATVWLSVALTKKVAYKSVLTGKAVSTNLTQ